MTEDKAMYEADAQHQDELLKQERLLHILAKIWWHFDFCYNKDLKEDDIFYLASAIGLSKEFTKYITGD